MANIYQQKDSNIFKTWLLFTLFFGVVIGIGWVFSQVYNDSSILVFAVIFSSIMSFVSYWYSDKIVLRTAGAEEVTMQNNPELYRVVENLAITAGLPMPKLYVVPEMAPNAFATGRDAKHAALAVTEGLLEKMDRTELEGVIAHELSHVGNRDMLVGTVAVVLVGFISLLANIFMRSMWFRGSRRDERDSAGGYLMLIGIILSILAPISATLLQLAISRRRESLADASGALLMRYPEGLASALEKIAADETPMRHANSATAHLWLSDPFRGPRKTPFFHKLFMTHPPIEERIAALREMEV